MNSPIRFAIVGYGNIGTRHAKIISENTDCVLIAVCDINEQKSSIVPKNVSFYTDLNQLLYTEVIDVLCICTPNGLHKAHALMGLKAHTSVLVEKPLSISSQDGKEIITCKKLVGKEVFTVMQNRFNPAILFTKKLLENQSLGKILSVQINCFWNRGESYYKESLWRGTLNMDGGVIYTQFSHFVDILYSFFGKTEVLSGFISNQLHSKCSELADTGTFTLKAGNCLINFNFTINSYQKNMEGSITLFGSKGTIKVGGQYLNQVSYFEVDNKDTYLQEINMINDSPTKNNQYGSYQGSMSNHDKVFQNLVDHLLYGKKYYTSAEEGLAVVEMIEDMYASAKILN